MKTPSADGTEIYFEIHGQGDTALLFVHGWLGNTQWWNSQRDHFSEKYQVAVMDLAGHGQSGKTRSEYSSAHYADDIVTVANQLSAKKVILIGHSMSGVYVTEAASRVKNLSLVVLVDTMKNLDFFFTAEQTESFLKMYLNDFTNVVHQVLPNYLFVEQTPAEVKTLLQNEFLQQGAEFAVKAIRPFYETDIRPAARKVDVPMRAIVSEVGPTEREINRQYFKDYDYLTLGQVGHYPMLERPEAFNLLLEEALLTPWTQADKDLWLQEQTVKRSYQSEVVSKIEDLKSNFDVAQYGAVTVGNSDYPVFFVRSKKNDPAKKTVLITGGVHGYETSGVHGALSFMKNEASKYADQFNFICAPCISPWAYETINRWNSKAIDPNRSFIANSPAQECAVFLKAIAPDLSQIYVHFDLHETTDTDNSVFRPALEKRDGKKQELSDIPDGFYTVGDSENPCPEFQAAIIDSVRKVTHIAAPDHEGKIIGAKLEQDGVIHYPLKKLSLCAGVSNAKYTTTTEVYPDSPKVTDAICIDAQVAAIQGGLNYLQKI